MREPLDSHGSRCSADDITDVDDIALSAALLPQPVGAGPRLNNAVPSVQLHYKAFRPTTNRSVPVPRIGTLVLSVSANWIFSLCIGATGSHVPYESLMRTRAVYMPDAARAGSGHPPNLSQGFGVPLVSTSPDRFDTSATVRLRSPFRIAPAGISSRLFRNAHHHRSLRSQLAEV